MPSASGVMRRTLAADVPTLLHLIQSIPSPKTEPFKQWLAKVGSNGSAECTPDAKTACRFRRHAVLF
jgi:DNA-damage-inducible protein D